jgi:hypothetical protein
VYAQEDIIWYPADKCTMEWDHVTTFTNGDPIPENETVYYRVYMKNKDNTNERVVSFFPFEDNKYTFTINDEGNFILGVSSLRILENAEYESDISWSDNPEVCENNQAFGVTFIYIFSNPLRIRRK